jgi:hypothetical protein
MEIAALDKDAIKIKGKHTSFIIDPSQASSKNTADAIMFLSDFSDSTKRSAGVGEARVSIKGPGSYEIGGVRISATASDNNFFYLLNVDGMNVFLGRSERIENQQEKGECQVLVLNVDSAFKESMVTSFGPSVAVLYGENAEAAAKSLGKEYQSVSKFQQSADKLPADMQVILLK